MTESLGDSPAPKPRPSLIQQRLALKRLRFTALFMMILWGAGAAVRLFGGFDVTEVIDWIAFIGPLAAALCGTYLWFDYRRKVRAFEVKYGPDAGEQ